MVLTKKLMPLSEAKAGAVHKASHVMDQYAKNLRTQIKPYANLWYIVVREGNPSF